MPSPNIVRAIRTKIQNQVLPSVSSRWQHQLWFGLQAYGLRSFHSAAGNARMVGANTHTAMRKAERLFQNTRLTDRLGTVFDSLGLVKPTSFVNVDHSDMNGLTALVGAIQTRNGRALPCFVETTYSDSLSARTDAPPRRKALRNARSRARRGQSFTGHTIDALQNFADRLGFWPKLVFDRGFGNESIISHLAAEGCMFYVRLKQGRFVDFDGQKTEVGVLTEQDATIRLYGLTLRVIRSPKSRRAKEPWYILTNDFTSSRNKVVKVYYHRFEIEETFRDIKHIWELKRTRLNKPNSLKLILWLVSIGIALLYLTAKPTKLSNPKKQTSWLRQAYEQLQQAYSLLLWGQG